MIDFLPLLDELDVNHFCGVLEFGHGDFDRGVRCFNFRVFLDSLAHYPSVFDLVNFFDDLSFDLSDFFLNIQKLIFIGGISIKVYVDHVGHPFLQVEHFHEDQLIIFF